MFKNFKTVLADKSGNSKFGITGILKSRIEKEAREGRERTKQEMTHSFLLSPTFYLLNTGHFLPG